MSGLKITIEPPGNWGAARQLIVRLRKLGYVVTEERWWDVPGGRSLLVITG